MISRLGLQLAILAIIVSSSQGSLDQDSPSCLDDDGNPVDWFIAYKFPILHDQPQPFKSGLSYAYITSEAQSNSSSKWIVSKKRITNPKSLILRSLEMAYAGNRTADDLNWILYNDQPPVDLKPKLPSGKKAHAKGVVIMDIKNTNGIWLTHSVPQFPPPLGQRLHFDENVSRYGQTFMCLNFDIKQAGLQIANHLSNMNALIYDTKIDDDLFRIVPGLERLRSIYPGTRGRRGKARGQAKLKQEISTRAGRKLNIYSKSSELESDLYAGWLEHELDSSLYVESWQNGNGNPLNSSCSDPDYKVNNVRELRLYDGKTIFSWQHQKDHSKWAISESQDKSLVCIADINRMESQFERGGGAVCMKCSNCWNVFSKTILDVEPCPVKRVRYGSGQL